MATTGHDDRARVADLVGGTRAAFLTTTTTTTTTVRGALRAAVTGDPAEGPVAAGDVQL